MFEVYARALELLKRAWPVLVISYFFHLVFALVTVVTVGVLGNLSPPDFNLLALLDYESIGQVAASSLSFLAAALLALLVYSLVILFLFVLLVGGTIDSFRSVVISGGRVELFRFFRAGFHYFSPLLLLNFFVSGAGLLFFLVAEVIGGGFWLLVGAKAFIYRSAPSLVISLLILLFLVFLDVAAMLVIGLASGVGAARLVWDDLPVLTTLRLFARDLKLNLGLHFKVIISLVAVIGITLMLTLMVGSLANFIAGGAVLARALAVLIQISFWSVVTMFGLAVMTALMEAVRARAEING